jgi:hypothetical protein
VALADQQSMMDPLWFALNGGSVWLREVAIKSCRILPSPSEEIKRTIRKHPHKTYFSLKFIREFSSYALLFSSSPAFYPLLQYLRLLFVSLVIQSALMVIPVTAFLMAGQPMLSLAIAFATVFLIIFLQDINDQSFFIVSAFSAFFFLTSLSFLPGVVLIAGSLFFISFIEVFMYFLVDNYVYENNEWLVLPKKLALRARDAVQSVNIRLLFLVLLSLPAALFLVIAFISVPVVVDRCGFRVSLISCAVQTSSFVGLVFIIVGLLLWLTAIWYFLWAALRDIPSGVNKAWSFIVKEPLILRRLSLDSSRRPKSVADAMEILDMISVDIYRIQYIRMLQAWFPSVSNSDLVRQKADTHKGRVRDELYKLVEIWQDAQKV